MNASEARALAEAAIPKEQIAKEVGQWMPIVLAKVASQAKIGSFSVRLKMGVDLPCSYPPHWVAKGLDELVKELKDKPLLFQAEVEKGVGQTALVVSW